MQKDKPNCKKNISEQEYTHLQEFIDNLPYIFMAVLGALVLILGTSASLTGWLLAGLYTFYSITGAFWIIAFVCPFCHHYGTRTCPCGYGQISAKLRKVQDQSRFIEKFKKHIPLIIPLWILPLVAGIIYLLKDFTLSLLSVVVLFVVDAYLVLPLLSRKYGCAHCPQRSTCPWMSEAAKCKTEKAKLVVIDD
jgi:hypothetical protein